MAEAVIVGIAGKIVAYLVPQALDNVGMLWGVNHELKALRETVSALQSVLDHAEEQYHQSYQIKDWVDKLKEAFYDAQDVLEEFNVEAMRRELRGHNEMMKEVKTFFSSSNQLAFKRKMSYKVRHVRKRIEAIKADKGFHLDQRLEREWRKRDETHSFIPKEYVIGREDDKGTIMEFLLDSDMQENVSILPIVGIGGLGKTALAQSVYNDEKVSKQFNLKMWVCVSDDFDMKKIVKKMLDSANKGEPIRGAMDRLQSNLRAAINGKKYLLVLDDFWNIEREKWLNLKILLDEGAKGSKILITTRLPLVVNIIGTNQAHSLKGLSDGMSFDLLMQIACCKEEELQDPNMRVIGEDIVRKCSGVPLVIRIVGSLLYKQTKSEWLHIKDYELPQACQGQDSIKSVLKLSYDHLPSHLKQCFAFCSLFPKDYELKRQTLVDLWMAEGFIQPSDRGQHLEDIANGYFKDLLWRNFFQEFQEDVGTCKMHDLMHDLARSVAGTECWVAWDDKRPIHERTRHISRDSTFNLTGELPSALRTYLYAIEYKRQATSEPNLCQLIQSFKRLRILDLQATKFMDVPRSIYKFKHLTYLDLSYNNLLKRLPNSITRLHNLQTLNLCHCESLEELPRDIRKLVSLRNLDIDERCLALSYMPCGLGQLSSLHRLSRFILPKDKALAKKYCRLGELNRLNNIRGELFIENLGSVIDIVKESQAANLREKCSLEVMGLSWGNFNITDEAMITTRDEALLDRLRPPNDLRKLVIDQYNGESFPRWMTELSNLVELTLTGCERCKYFPDFRLSKLKRLRIIRMKILDYLPGECLGSLTSLESLNITSLPRLTSLPLGLGHLSKLMDLSIEDCEELNLSKDESSNIISDFHGFQSLRSVYFSGIPKLEYLPQWILQLRSLEHLNISNCPNFKELSEQIEKCEELDISKDKSNNILDFHGGLHSLCSMQIYKLPKLTSLPQWLLQARNLERLTIKACSNLKDIPEQIEALQSLQNLNISQCSLLTSLPKGIRRLLSLTDLVFSFCEELDISKDESGNILDFHGGLHSLCSVSISSLPKLTSLPQWLLQACNLKCLTICYCRNLMDIPEQIEALQSLKYLDINGCHALKSFPEAMRRLTSLTFLQIADCGELEESCKRQAGEEWDKIAHIPNIQLGWP